MVRNNKDKSPKREISSAYDFDKLWSLEADAGVLGSMIIAPAIISEVLDVLPYQAAFYLPEHS